MPQSPLAYDGHDALPGWIARGTVPGLDSLRAMAISCVLLAHAMFAVTNSSRALVVGIEGVDTFFVISGFLITLLLLRERARTGSISLRGFYRRRAFRIMPAYCAYLLAIFITTHLGRSTVHPGDWLAAFTYTMNWRKAPPWVLGHLWSLSVEAQFYLLWPPLFILLSRRSAMRLLACCIAAAPAYRIMMRGLLPHLEAAGRRGFPARLEPIAAGCLLALLASEPNGFALLRRWLSGWLQLALAMVLLVACALLATRSKMFDLFGRSTCSALVLLPIVWNCVSSADSLLSRLLAWRPIVAIGILSYSIYLWQQPFLDGANPSHACQFPLNIGLSLVAAACSYFLIERPMLNLKVRDRKSSSRPDEGLPSRYGSPAAT